MRGKDMHATWPEVLVSYGTGTREGLDEPGCGPGMYFCQAVVSELEKAGISTFSGLHVGAGTDWRIFLQKLNSIADCPA